MFPVDTSVRLIGVFTGLAALCEAIAFFGAGLYAYEQTHSTVSVAIVMASVACAETAGAVIGGALADRFDRKRVAALAAIGSAAMLAVLVVGADIWWLTFVMTIATLCASPIRPAISAALPNLVVHDHLDSANGYVQAWRNAAMTLGPVAVGVGAGLFGARGLFVVAAAALLAGVAVLAAVRGPFHAKRDSNAVEVSDSPFEGLNFLFRDRVLGIVVVAGVVSVLTAACGMVADLPYALHDLNIGEAGYGVLLATWGVGMTGGSLLAPLAIRRLGPATAFGIALFVEAVGIMGAALFPVSGIAMTVFIIGGLGGGVGVVADQLLIQQRVPDAARGRVRAANDALVSAAYAISLGFGGIIVAVLGARGTYAFAAIGCFVAGLLATIALREHRVGAGVSTVTR
ncbi:MAG TPA: MFS transporter [Gaiellales bacterium]|jgi:MFS family permease